MLNLDSSETRFVCQERDLISEHFSVSSLDQERRQSSEFAEERRNVGMGEVVCNRVAEEALDGMKMIVFGSRVR